MIIMILIIIAAIIIVHQSMRIFTHVGILRGTYDREDLVQLLICRTVSCVPLAMT
jgi:hypothetical protein